VTSRAEIDRLLRRLEADIPTLTTDMNSFFREFEDRSEKILGFVDNEHQEYVLDCPLAMLRRAGVTQRDGYKGPTLH
jgi:hypothetical protein